MFTILITINYFRLDASRKVMTMLRTPCSLRRAVRWPVRRSVQCRRGHRCNSNHYRCAVAKRASSSHLIANPNEGMWSLWINILPLCQHVNDLLDLRWNYICLWIFCVLNTRILNTRLNTRFTYQYLEMRHCILVNANLFKCAYSCSAKKATIHKRIKLF